MNFPISALLVVQLTTTLGAITLSDEISLTCPDTAQRQLKDISEVYNCTLFFGPEEKVLTCVADIFVAMYNGKAKLTFKILEENPEGTAMCLGLQEYSVQFLVSLRISFDFNPLLAVGILTPDNNTSKTDRFGTISLLSDVLNLKIFSNFTEWELTVWDFSSPLLSTHLNWFQGFSISNKGDGLVQFQIWLEGLHNTSIQLLSIQFLDVIDRFKDNIGTILVKDMPFLREMILVGVSVETFPPDSFIGMPEMEVLSLKNTLLHGIPEMIDRMPKLKRLEIVRGKQELLLFSIPEKLSTLKNLEVLNLSFNIIYSITQIPPILKLRILNLDGCKFIVIYESDFEGFPELVELTLSHNGLTHLEENTFRRLTKLKLLDLSFNKFTKWPTMYDFSFILLDLSHNLLFDVDNLGNNGTTVEILNISHNSILQWGDKYVFSLRKSLIPLDDRRSKLSMSQRKLFYRIPENLSFVNFYDQTELSKSNNVEKVIANNFENTVEYSSPIKSDFWVKKVNISSNLISDLSETMMQSLEGMHEVDLGGNPFKCVDCRMIPLQKWLNTTSTNISNLGTSDPLLCSAPDSQRGTPVNLVQYDEEPCLEKIRTTSLLTLIGAPVGAISVLVVAAAAVVYRFRSGIGYMLHLYKIRRRAMAFSQSVFNKYAFDAFICYSSEDRRFVLTKLAPLLEKGQEQYRVCLHERDFPLGSHIVSNIVGSIQHSRKTIIVLSDHFIKSKWCNWELEMANHKMFNEDEHFLILIQLQKIDRNKLPRHLQFLMDTRTYLEWPSPGQNDEEELKRLKNALGPSIFQTTNERAPLLSEVMEEY